MLMPFPPIFGCFSSLVPKSGLCFLGKYLHLDKLQMVSHLSIHLHFRERLADLNPRYPTGFDPVFDNSNVDMLNSIEIILKPNQLLFVPFGWPHTVENLEDSVAVSGNFVDASNYQQVKRHLRRNCLGDPRAGDLLKELVNIHEHD